MGVPPESRKQLTLEQQRKRFRRLQQEKLQELQQGGAHDGRRWRRSSSSSSSDDEGFREEDDLDVGALRLEDVISPQEYAELMEDLEDDGSFVFSFCHPFLFLIMCSCFLRKIGH